MASSGRKKASSKESVDFKVERLKWSSTDYYIYNTSIPEKGRCHGCGCVSNTLYPLENECQGHGLCRDCKETDFNCHHHHGYVTAESMRNAIGQKNVAAKKLRFRCLFCESCEDTLSVKDHMSEKHSEVLADILKSSQETEYEQEEKLRRDNLGCNANVSVETEDDEAPACKHCNEEWDVRELGEHEKACPKKKVECRDCEEWMKQEELSDHKRNCQLRKCNFCNEKMPKEEITRHGDICEEKNIPCLYRIYGCEKEDKRKNMKYHEEHDSHALFFLPKIQELQERIRQLEPPIGAILKRFEHRA